MSASQTAPALKVEGESAVDPDGGAASPPPPHPSPPDPVLPAKTFRVNRFWSAPSRRGRPARKTKYTEEERFRVMGVRRQRACLRCKVLKIQCSKENPCRPCLASASKGFEKRVLSFCYCVRTRYVDVNIFDGHPEVPESLLQAVAALVSRIHGLPAAAAGDSQEKDASFEDLVVHWLTDPAFVLPTGSVVSALCTRIRPRPSEGIDAAFVADFRSFLFSATAAHAGWRPGSLSTRDFCKAAHVCGSRVVRRLDRLLSPQSLADCSPETVRTLLLVVLGTALAVSYSTRLATAGSSPSFPHEMLSPQLRESPTLWVAMRDHLGQMLAHHLIFLGSLIGIRLDTAEERDLIDHAGVRWGKQESNVWGELLLQSSSNGSDNGLAGPVPPAAAPPPPLVAFALPAGLAGLPLPTPLADEDRNPESYLAMAADDYFRFPAEPAAAAPKREMSVSCPNTPTTAADTASPLSPGVPLGLGRPPGGYPLHAPSAPARRFQRRSMWVVQPVAADPQGLVNVHARLGTGAEGLFV